MTAAPNDQGRALKPPSHRTETADKGSIWPWVAVAVLLVALAGCGGGGSDLPQSQLATAPRDSVDATPTPLPTPVPAGDDEPDDHDSSEEQPDAPASDDDSEGDSEAAAADGANLSTAGAWVDATANLTGLESSCGTVHRLSAHPYRDDLFAGVAANGLFRLDNTSGEWTPLGTSAGSDRIDNRLAWIAYDPNDPDRFWQAGIYGAGIFRTTDGGATFSQQGDVRHVDFVSVDPTNPFPSTLLAGGHEERVVYLSRDSGRSWRDISDSLPGSIGFTEYPIVVNPSTFVLGTRRSDNPGIFRSDDGGESWTTVYDGAVGGPPLIDGDTIYWLVDGGGLVVSKDSGQTFELQAGGIPGRPTTLSKLQDGRLLSHGDANLFISNDEGGSWMPVGPPLPFTPKGIIISSSDTAIYAWTHTCNFGDEGNPVLENSIIRLDVVGPDGETDS